MLAQAAHTAHDSQRSPAPAGAGAAASSSRRPGAATQAPAWTRAWASPPAGLFAGPALRVQAKLEVSQPGDPDEVEADRVAAQVMRMPDPAPAPPAVRHCACGGVAGPDGECAACRARRLGLQRQATAGAGIPSSAPPQVQAVLQQSGRPLDAATRAFMEPRFGLDFGHVRVHTDPAAAASARAVQALAYTVGPHVVFAPGRYAPTNPAGRALLAHELVHTLQQGGPAGAARPLIRRAVSPQMPRIREALSYGVFDWAITDAEAHDVLVILRNLADGDLRDTVAAMEAAGLVDRFFENLSEDDMNAEAETLQRVQNFRVFTRTSSQGATTVTLNVVGSCSPARGDTLFQAAQTALAWLNTAANQLNEFIAQPAGPAGQAMGQALQTNFHTQNPSHAGLIRDRLQAIAREATRRANFASECAAPSDPLCRALAAAYVRPGTPQPQGVRWCPSFFEEDAASQAKTIIHESAHAFLVQIGATTFVEDRAYAHERVYTYLRPEEAMDNADSYARLAQDLATRPASVPLNRPQDEVQDCGGGSDAAVRQAVAFAARWNLNAINVLADTRPDFRAGYANLRQANFGSDDPARIPDWLAVFQRARSEFEQNMSWECETAGGACSGSSVGYYRYFLFLTSSTLHLCPVWFIHGDQARIEELYALVLSHVDVAEADRYKYVHLAHDLTNKYWVPPGPLPASPAGGPAGGAAG